MRAKLFGLAAGALMAAAAFGATSASGATEIGNNCVGNTAVADFSLVQLSASPGGLPITASASGVITKWRVNVIPFGGTIPEQLRVLRGSGNTFQTVAESGIENVVGGQNTFSSRIPIQGGDRVGVYSALETIFCITGSPADAMGIFEGNATVGSTQTYFEAKELQPAVSATIEPDADNDGYGDETQDKCPQSAATQAPCPVAALSSSAAARKGLANVLVTSNIQAAVTVGGTVKLGKGKTATLSGGTQIVLPGVISKFILLFTQKLKAKLKQLTPKQSLTLKVTATAPNVAGPPSVSTLNVKLKGQKKPKRKKGKAKAKGQA